MQNTTATAWTPTRIIETADGILVNCSCHRTPFPSTMVDGQGRCLWSRDFDEDTKGAWLAQYEASKQAETEQAAEVEQADIEEVIEASQVRAGMFIERKTYSADGRGFNSPIHRIQKFETVRIIRQTKNLKDRAIYEVADLSGRVSLLVIGHGRRVTRVHIEGNADIMDLVARGIVYSPKYRR